MNVMIFGCFDDVGLEEVLFFKFTFLLVLFFLQCLGTGVLIVLLSQLSASCSWLGPGS